jgi:hypothetical protein
MCASVALCGHLVKREAIRVQRKYVERNAWYEAGKIIYWHAVTTAPGQICTTYTYILPVPFAGRGINPSLQTEALKMNVSSVVQLTVPLTYFWNFNTACNLTRRPSG